WWHWPLWQRSEREGGRLATRLARDDEQRKAWRGLLQVAVPVFLLLAGGMLLAWPDLLEGNARLIAVAAYAGLLPIAHLSLQAVPVRALAHGLPVVEMEADEEAGEFVVDTDMPLALAAGLPAAPVVDAVALGRELYVAARNGRIDKALQLLDAGADPNLAPEPAARDRRGLAVLAAVLPDLRLLRALIERGADVNAAQAGVDPLAAGNRHR